MNNSDHPGITPTNPWPEPWDKNGRLEVAQAIAAVSGLVSVTLLGESEFDVVPDDLFERSFNDPKIGFGNSDMKGFKGNLKLLFGKESKEIFKEIEEIPENSNLVIGKVADLIKIALLKLNSSH